MYQKILLAYDGSEQGKTALLECADLAKLTGAVTHLLAVVRMPSGLFLAEGFIPENLLDDEKRRTEEVLKEGTQNSARWVSRRKATSRSANRSRKSARWRNRCTPISSSSGTSGAPRWRRAGGAVRSACR